MYSNVFSSEIRQQNRTEQNRTEQNRTEQNRTLTGLPCQSRAKRIAEQTLSGFHCQQAQNYYKTYFIAKENLAKFISVV